MDVEALQIPPSLQEAWVRRLAWHFEQYNYQYLRERLRKPLFVLSRSRSRLGEWNAARRTITISQLHILSHPWEVVLDTLRHEMAHQYVDEILCLPGAPPHGEPFVKACHLLRCKATAGQAGSELGEVANSTAERDEMLERVKALLALATSPNEHEAANAMRMANKYLLKYNLDLLELEAHRRYDVRHLGPCATRFQEYEYTLGNLLQDHFFVNVIWTFSYDPRANKPGRRLEIIGTPENLEIAEYVYEFVMRLVEPLWQRYRSRQGKRPVTKFQYLAGVLRGFRDKLDSQRQTLEQERALVWRGDPELDSFYRYRNPRTRSVSASGVRRNRGFRDGYDEGKKITIRKGIRSHSRARGRALPPPRG